MEKERQYLYPLRLLPIMKSAIWGGTRLTEEYGKKYDGERLAETWELTSRTPEESAMIENGAAAGMLLCDYFSDYKSAVGTKHKGDRFPLLIKWIDAADRLSVQVHPSDDYALLNEGDLGKTEMWYVAEAKENTKLIYGMADGVDKEAFCNAAAHGDFAGVMKEIPVSKGDVVFIPAGMLHAIGEGIVIAEIQQSSSVTYRVYDYDRCDKDGNKRPLHVDKAFDVLRPFTEDEVLSVRYARGKESTEADETLLCDCPYFRVSLLSLDGKVEKTVQKDSFVHLLCTEGEGSICFEGEEYPFKKGDGYLLPADMGAYALSGDATLLLSKL